MAKFWVEGVKTLFYKVEEIEAINEEAAIAEYRAAIQAELVNIRDFEVTIDAVESEEASL